MFGWVLGMSFKRFGFRAEAMLNFSDAWVL